LKITVNQIPFEGLILEEEFDPAALDLETEIIKFRGALQVKAQASRVGSAVIVQLHIQARMLADCSRCLEPVESGFVKDARLNYAYDTPSFVIDLNPDIREEVILDYPIKPLCGVNCKGLCVKCGRNLNQGGCSCGST